MAGTSLLALIDDITTIILLVDDDPVILRIYQEGLAERGFEITTAGDDLAAMKTLLRDRPDLVVLDLMMPKLSGVDVLKYIRSQPELVALPVVVLSNSYMDELVQGAASVDGEGVRGRLHGLSASPIPGASVIPASTSEM